MNNICGLTPENLVLTLPDVLKQDEGMRALASAVADILSGRSKEIENILIYPCVDEMPEELLDILAYDFKVDWYNYDYPLQAKRELIKSSPYVHRHLGTKGAIMAAVTSVYPKSIVEEWFEYGGNPFCFRVIVDVGSPVIPIVDYDLYKTIDLYKSFRSRLDGIMFRSKAHIQIGCKCGYIVYGTRVCGTFPSRATQGAIAEHNLIVETSANGVAYSAAATGTLEAGTYPSRATQGAINIEKVAVELGTAGIAYSTPNTGNGVSGIYPATATQGAMNAENILLKFSASGVAYEVPVAGVNPEIATQGGVESSGIYADVSGAGIAYSTPLCGTAPGGF